VLWVLGWFDNRHYHSLPTAIHLTHQAILNANTNSTKRVNVFNHPLNSTADEKTQEYLESGTDLTVAINTIMALSFVPASFVVFLIAERVSNAKHLQVGTARKALECLMLALFCVLRFAYIPCDLGGVGPGFDYILGGQLLVGHD